jgi:hypothetical protein
MKHAFISIVSVFIAFVSVFIQFEKNPKTVDNKGNKSHWGNKQ